MAMSGGMKGVTEAINALKKEHQEIVKDAARGLYKGALLVQRTALPLTPIDDGPLRESSYAEMVGPMTAQVGYTAEYAPHVHENLDANHPVGEAKFLEKAEKETRAQRKALLRKEMKR